MNAISWIFRRLTQNEFKAINDQIQSDGGGSQTYIDLPKGKISDDDLKAFFGEGTKMHKGYKWEVPVYSLSLDFPPQVITVSQRRDSSNCIREQNKEKRINSWKFEYSGFPKDSYSEPENPIYIFILKTDDENFYAGWFYSKNYKENWFITKNLCKPFFDESCGIDNFEIPIVLDCNNVHWPFRSLFKATSVSQKIILNQPLQLIYYGAPGTGKSYTIDKVTNENNSVRTTFHPDSDYAGFVGAYKPTMENVPVSAVVGTNVHIAQPKDGHSGWERKIVYKYVPQAFLKAYVEAWKRYGNGEPYYLVIEEINRGNCAQIFGDLFQLLDRNNVGSSSYAISADEDIRQFLAEDDKGFKSIQGTPAEEAIRNFVLRKDSGSEEAIGESVLNGSKLLLPPNLRIWATMNTSDQSLFPIDSAFKRRWNWEYMPIDTNPKYKETQESLNWKLEAGGKLYTWGSFLDRMNPLIDGITQSEDKQMGYFFAKPDKKSSEDLMVNDTISEKVFVNKVLFYLWTDVLKDYDLTQDVFTYTSKNDEGKDTKRPYKFTNFFPIEDNPLLKSFVEGLKLVEAGDNNESSQDFVEETPTDSLTQEKNKKLWGAFFEYAKNNGKFSSIFNVNRTASKDSWMDFTTGTPGVWLNVQQLRTKSKVRVSIVISLKSKIIAAYENKKADLESLFSEKTGLQTSTKTTGRNHLLSVEFGNDDFDSLEETNPIFKNIADNLILAGESVKSILV